MASVALLGVVQALWKEIALGQNVPTSVAGSTSQQLNQLVAHCNMTGDKLRDEFDWPALRKEATITTVNGTSGYTVSLVSGGSTFACSRIISDTGWDYTNRWFFVGSVSDQMWAEWQNGISTTPIRKIWRTTADNAIEVYPTPGTDGDELKVSFITSAWARTVAGVAKTELGLDDDYHLFNDRLFITAAKYLWLESKGLPFGAPKDEYDRMLPVRKSASRTPTMVSLSRRRVGRHFLNYLNVPDTGFGS